MNGETKLLTYGVLFGEFGEALPRYASHPTLQLSCAYTYLQQILGEKKLHGCHSWRAMSIRIYRSWPQS